MKEPVYVQSRWSRIVRGMTGMHAPSLSLPRSVGGLPSTWSERGVRGRRRGTTRFALVGACVSKVDFVGVFLRACRGDWAYRFAYTVIRLVGVRLNHASLTERGAERHFARPAPAADVQYHQVQPRQRTWTRACCRDYIARTRHSSSCSTVCGKEKGS